MRALFLQLLSRGSCKDSLFLPWCCCLDEKWLATIHCFSSKGTREGYCCPAIRCNIDPPHPCCLLRLQRAPFLLRCDCAVTRGTKSGSQLGLNMELHAHLHLIKLSGICQAEKPLQRGTEVPDKRPGYPGRRLSRASFVTYMGWLSRSRLSESREVRDN